MHNLSHKPNVHIAFYKIWNRFTSLEPALVWPLIVMNGSLDGSHEVILRREPAFPYIIYSSHK